MRAVTGTVKPIEMILRKRVFFFALAAVLAAPALFAYNVKLKDGSIIFARTKYEVKGKKAIITLQNGTVTQIDLDLIDVPGTDQYNRENPGNVIAIQPGEPRPSNVSLVTPRPTTSLQDVIRQRKVRLEVPKASASAEEGAPGSWQQPEMAVEAAFRRIFDGAAITQYRLMNARGKLRLLATANTEEAVFNTLSAAARVLAELAEKGKAATVEIALTTSSGEPGGSFSMTAEQARQIVNGNIAVADYFVRNVIL